MLTIQDAMFRKEQKGDQVCVKCVFMGEGVTWLGFGKTTEEAVSDLQRAITNYFTPYDSQ